MTDATDDLDWQEYKMVKTHNYLLQQRGNKMSDSVEVVVEKISSNGQGFASDGTWYNFQKNKKPANLPRDIGEGCTITIHSPFTGKTGSIYFSSYEVSDAEPVEVKKAAPAAKAPFKKAFGGGNDDAKQRLIVRQNALTNTCNLVAAGKIAADAKSIKATVDMFTNIVFEDAPVNAEEAQVEKKAVSKPPVKKKAEPVVMEEEEDGDDPFDVE